MVDGGNTRMAGRRGGGWELGVGSWAFFNGVKKKYGVAAVVLAKRSRERSVAGKTERTTERRQRVQSTGSSNAAAPTMNCNSK